MIIFISDALVPVKQRISIFYIFSPKLAISPNLSSGWHQSITYEIVIL